MGRRAIACWAQFGQTAAIVAMASTQCPKIANGAAPGGQRHNCSASAALPSQLQLARTMRDQRWQISLRVLVSVGDWRAVSTGHKWLGRVPVQKDMACCQEWFELNSLACSLFPSPRKGYEGRGCEAVQQAACLNGCQGRGSCIGGFCHCRPGFWVSVVSRS